MYYFFEKHKLLRIVLDWAVLLTVGFTIMTLFTGSDFGVSWFVPVYINMFVICLFAYVDWVHEPKENRLDLVNWMNNIRWINAIALGLHTTVGFFKKGSFDVIVPPIWEQSTYMIILTLSIYIFMILIPTIVIKISKRN